jgi:mono/diheme cytochrome c family protein
MRKAHQAAIVSIGFLFLAFGAYAARSLTAGQTAPSVPDEIKSLFEKHCAGCHKGLFAPKNLKLGPDSLPGSILNVVSREKPDLKLADQAAPEKSYVLKKIRGDEGISGKRMPPPNKTPLSAEEITLIENWLMGLK